MGQQAPKRFSHTQEIAFGPSTCETHTVSRATLEDMGAQEPYRCRAVMTPSCCAVDDSAPTVEEILVVHHDALRKVNFLLKVDEFSGAELPSVPECVVAVKRAELQRSHQQSTRELKQLRGSGADGSETSPSSGGRVGPCGPVCLATAWDDSDSEDPSPILGPGRRPSPNFGPSMQPSAWEEEDFGDVDGFGPMPPPGPPPQPVTAPKDRARGYACLVAEEAPPNPSSLDLR